MLTHEKIEALQNKYGFNKAKDVKSSLLAYKAMVHDPSVSKEDILHDLEVAEERRKSDYKFNQVINILNNELKSRR